MTQAAPGVRGGTTPVPREQVQGPRAGRRRGRGERGRPLPSARTWASGGDAATSTEISAAVFSDWAAPSGRRGRRAAPSSATSPRPECSLPSPKRYSYLPGDRMPCAACRVARRAACTQAAGRCLHRPRRCADGTRPRHRTGARPAAGLVDLDAVRRLNAADLTRRAAGRPDHGSPPSTLRCRYLIERALAGPAYQGVMCYSLPEALWLHAAGTSDDTAGRLPHGEPDSALRATGLDEVARRHIRDHGRPRPHTWTWWTRPWATAIPRSGSAWRSTSPGGRWPSSRWCTSAPGASPVFTPGGPWTWPAPSPRPAGFALTGLMAYEGQIAGLGDASRPGSFGPGPS